MIRKIHLVVLGGLILLFGNTAIRALLLLGPSLQKESTGTPHVLIGAIFCSVATALLFWAFEKVRKQSRPSEKQA